MENFTINVAAAPLGAAFAGACSPWTSLSAVGTNHVRTQSPVPAAGTPDARRAAFRQVPAMTKHVATLAAELPAVTSDTRKQNVLKTRINGGGYGAMGPHPEREPA